MFCKSLISFSLSMLFSFPLFAQLDSFKLRLSQLIKTQYSDFNGSLLAADSNEVLILQSYGFVDAEKTALLHKDVRYNVGSFAKEIPSIIILDLIKAQRLSFGDTVDKYLSDLPGWSSQLTIEDLLFHSSGLPRLNFRKIKSDEEALNSLKSTKDLAFNPGMDYLYSNFNNVLQVAIIEQITKRKYQNIVFSDYFEPLGIKNSFFDRSKSTETKNITKAFTKEFGNDEEGNPRFNDFQLSYGPLYMTIQDAHIWITYVSTKVDDQDHLVNHFFSNSTLDRQGPVGIIIKEEDTVLLHLHGGFAYSYGMATYRNYQSNFSLLIMTNNNEKNNLAIMQEKIVKLAEQYIKP